MIDPVVADTDRHLEEYGKAQEYEDDLEQRCRTCAECLKIIRPEQTARVLNPYVDARGVHRRIELFFHAECLEDSEEYTGEEIMDD